MILIYACLRLLMVIFASLIIMVHSGIPCSILVLEHSIPTKIRQVCTFNTQDHSQSSYNGIKHV